MVEAPHPQSVIRAASGREVQLKVHQCLWSGDFPANSLPAIQDCYRAHVARAEIDVAMLRDQDFLVVHDLDLARSTDGQGSVEETTCAEAERLRLVERGGETTTSVKPALLSEVVSVIVAEPSRPHV